MKERRMRNILYLRKEGFLTEQQVLTAQRFKMNPYGFEVATTLFRTLFDLIVKNEELEAYERRRGWAARSAKVVLSQLLFALEEVRGSHLDAARSDLEEANAEIAYLTGQCVEERSRAMSDFGLTPQEARFFLIMKRLNGRVASGDTIFRRLYSDIPENSWPSSETIAVYVSKTRSKVKSRWTIENVHGVGYRMVSADKVQALAG